MHKKLNVFEYEIEKDKKIELTTTQISNLLNAMFEDYHYFKHELDYNFKEKIDDYYSEYELNEDDEDDEDDDDGDDSTHVEDTKPKTDLKPKRSYNKNNNIKKLFNKYHDKTKTKTFTFRLISKELSISLETVINAYYKKSNY